MHIGEPEIPTGETVSQFLVIKAEEMQHRGMEIVDVNRIRSHPQPEIVRLAIGHSPFDAAPCHPDGEAIDMVIATDAIHVFLRHFLNRRSAAHFPAPDDEGILQHPACFEVP